MKGVKSRSQDVEIGALHAPGRSVLEIERQARDVLIEGFQAWKLTRSGGLIREHIYRKEK